MRTSRHAPPVYVACEGTRLRTTEMAVQFKFTKIRGVAIEPITAWIPKSQIQRSATDPIVPGRDTMMAAEWVLQKNGVLDQEAAEPQEESNDDQRDRYNELDPEDDIPF